MNKSILILVVCLIVWSTKLTVDVYLLKNQQLKQLDTLLDQQIQRLGNLNDQLVVLQKKTLMPNAEHPAIVSEHNEPASFEFSAQDYVIGRLQLIQSALQQQQFTLALEQMQDLRQLVIEKQPLAESLNQALLEALQRDQNRISIYLQQRTEHLQILQQQLNQVELAMSPKSLDRVENKWHWPSWLSIGRADQIPDLQNRALHYKQIQLQMLIARQAIYAGQHAFYQAQIEQIVQMLSAYPDQDSRDIITQLQKINTLTWSTPPQLKTLALLEEH